MKVSHIKQLLSAYSDNTELMIAFNDKESFYNYWNEPMSDEMWLKAVEVYENNSLEGFGDDCRWAINEAEFQLEKTE